MKSRTLSAFVLLALSALVQGTENPGKDKLLRNADQRRRRTFDLLSLLFSVGPKLPLPKPPLPKPKGHHPPPKEHKDGNVEGNTTQSGDESGLGTGSGVDDGASSGGDDGASSGGDGYEAAAAVSGSEEVSESNANSQSSSATNLGGVADEPLVGIMGAVALVALGTAMAAMLVGQNNGSKKKHPLEGCVQKRMGLFSHFVERHAHGPASRAEPRVVELAANKGDYQLA